MARAASETSSKSTDLGSPSYQRAKLSFGALNPQPKLDARLLEERQEMRSKQKVKEHPVTKELLQSLQFLPTQSLFPRLRAIVTVARAEQMALRAFAYENFLAVVKDHMATPGSWHPKS